MKLLLQFFKTMEKSAFHVLIKHCFQMGKKNCSSKANNLINVIQTLLHWKKLLRGGMLTLNTYRHKYSHIQTQMMLNAQFTQIWQLSWKNTKKLHNLILADRKLKLCEIAEELKISEGSVFTILHGHLSMGKLCSKWVLRLLTVHQKQQHVDDSEHCLQLF